MDIERIEIDASANSVHREHHWSMFVCSCSVVVVVYKDQRLHWTSKELTWFEYFGWRQLWWQVVIL